jgi:hypothetical protein
MIKRLVVAMSLLAGIAGFNVASTAPAEAGYWRHGVWFPVVMVPRTYHCWWEVRVREYWRHGYLHRVRERVRVCD